METTDFEKFCIEAKKVANAGNKLNGFAFVRLNRVHMKKLKDVDYETWVELWDQYDATKDN